MQTPSAESGGTSAADRAACRALLRGGSLTFHAASFLLPARVREPATALYAFCRLADDAIDLETRKFAALAQLRERLDRIYAGRPLPFAADRAFAAVVAQFAIPRTLPEALLEGFEWDAAARRYESLAELEAYAARVAGSVGAMMSLLMGARSAAVLARACDLGVAMQLTNIARDVGEDARVGRLYLPLQWLRQAGIDPQRWLAAPRFDAALGGVVARLLEVADVRYARAAAGIAWLPRACRPGMHAARILYAEIGREVERRGLDSVTQRAHVPLARKLALLPQAMAMATARRRQLEPDGFEATRFLVEAAAGARPLPETREGIDRVTWVLTLFERLERQQLSTMTRHPR